MNCRSSFFYSNFIDSSKNEERIYQSPTMFASTTNANLKNCLRKRYLILQATLKHSCRSYFTSGLEYGKIFPYKIKNDQLLPQNTTVFQISSILLQKIKIIKTPICLHMGRPRVIFLPPSELVVRSNALQRSLLISDS